MKEIPYDLWEPVIGLEIHMQLNTASKLFSSAANQFGAEPNTNISAVCTGQPGSLPLLNREAVRKAVQFGLAVRGKIALVSRFDRKSYFYPDSPRNFQITQFDHPIIRGGTVTADVEGVSKTFQINRAHIEDDAGMLKHFSSFAGVDYNRAGAPLIEIVSEPCMHSPKEASAYAQAIRAIMVYLGASNANMDEGEMRMDVNISVRPRGEKSFRPRIEVKNMNSFTFLEWAVEAEVRRQIMLYAANPGRPFEELIPAGTYRWDQESRQVVLMRKKESADDYRYFPEPDLPPVVLSQQFIDEIAANLPELPHDRFRRYTTDLGLTPYAASVLINDLATSNYFEEALKSCPHPRILCNWITVEFSGRYKESGKTLVGSGILAAHVAKLVSMIESGAITGKIAKAVADEMVKAPGIDPETIVKANPDFQPVGGASEIEPLVDQVLAENAQSIADYKAGKSRAFGFLVGQVMKLARGRADPEVVNELLRKKLG